MTKSTLPPISVSPINSEADLERTASRLYELACKGFEDGSVEDAEYTILQTLADAWQKEHAPLGPLEPLEAIRFQMEQSRLSEKELERILGGPSRSRQIMSGTRKLSLGMIRALHEKLGIPAEVLIRAY